MGRKSKYETHVQPHLEDIKEWITEETEGDIAKRLRISQQSFENYKKNYPELQEALRCGKEELISELRQTLKRKARGYTYTETKTIIRDDGKNKVKIIEKNERYAHPDTGAIHLLLKNLDKTWRNDDHETMEIKKKQVELTERKLENEEW